MNFDTKIVVVVRADLLMWQKLNVTAFTVSGIAGLPDVLGEHYVDGSDTSYLPMIKQPITAAEERGLKGARSFLTWAKEHDLTLAEVMNLDMLGRDRLAVRPSALPGFYFWLPLLGKLVYDGRRLRQRQSYALPDQGLVRRLSALMRDDIVIYQRFTAYSDANVFQEAGVPTTFSVQ